MTIVMAEPVRDRSAWTGADLAADPSWRFQLGDAGVSDLEEALAQVRSRHLAVAEIAAEDFPLPNLAPTLSAIVTELRHGRGFATLAGFPVDRPLEDLERMYWGLCTHLGTGITQNSDASLIHYVTDGALRPNQGARGVGVPTASHLHVDLTDVASLLCVRQAPDDPTSWVASSATVHNELLTAHPEALARLYEGFEWDRMGEEHPGESPTTGYRVPVFSQRDGVLSCRYNRYWMARAAERYGGFDEADRAVLDLFDEIAHRGRFEFDFRPGDIQFVDNYTVLHGRAAHEVVTDEERKRLLMRIWLDMEDRRPVADEAIVRYGIVRHGSLGWTAAQLAAGLHRGDHPRRSDGAPLVGDGDGRR